MDQVGRVPRPNRGLAVVLVQEIMAGNPGMPKNILRPGLRRRPAARQTSEDARGTLATLVSAHRPEWGRCRPKVELCYE
jgi:hypothetical protein